MRMATIHLLGAVMIIGHLMPRPVVAACAGPVLHWATSYDSGGDEQGLAAAADPSGSVYVAGYVTVGGQGPNWWIRKYDPDGNVLWTQTYNNPGGNGSDYAQAIAVAPGGDVVVAGLEFTGTSYDWLVRRYSSGGGFVWSAGYNSPANDLDEARAVAIAPGGEVYVGGYETRSDTGQRMDWRIRKYSAAGAMLASWSYTGPSGSDFVEALAVDAAGFVYAAGAESRLEIGQDMNWRIAKYDPFGAEQWADTWNSPANSFDLAHGIAVAAGEVTVVGHEDRPDFAQGRDWRVRRYTDTGTLRWSVPYHGGAGFDDAYGVAMDALGRAYVAGYAEYTAGIGEWRITRYSPAGVPEWAITSVSTGVAYGIAVDPGGAVDITGFSGAALPMDAHTRRYRQPVCLRGAVSVTPAVVTVGQSMTVVFTVTNDGGVWAGGLPQAWAAGAGSAVAVAGPSLSATTLVLGAAASFTWTFSAAGAGAVTFTASVAGWDAAIGATVFVSASAGAVIQRPAAITGVLAVSPLAVRPGDAVTLVLTVSNSGDAAAANLRPTLRPVAAGIATAYLASGPLPAGPVTLAGGSTTVFVWVLTAGLPAGSFTLSVSATGADANAGFAVTTGMLAASAVTVSSPVEPCPASGANLAVFNGRAVGSDEAHAIAIASSGSIFVAGHEDREDISRQQDIAVIHWPAAGGPLYVFNDYSTAASIPDIAWGITWLPSREVAAVGQAANTFWLGRYTDTGSPIWQATPATVAGGPDELRAVAACANGDVVAAGRVRRTDLGQGDNLYVARYDPAGAIVWSLNYNSPANSDEAAFAVAVDGSGSVYVAGYETRTDLGQDRNVVVLKIGPNGGVPVWVRTYSSAPGMRDEARAIAVDAYGNVVVAGIETRTDLGQGENGWLGRWTSAGVGSWTTTFNSPLVRAGGPADRALGIALDPTGSEAFVTGRVERTNQAGNILLRRYAAATGAFLEEELRNGPNNGDDEGHAIARGPDGGWYVAGFEDWQNISQHSNWVVHRWNRPGCLQAALAVSQSPASTGQWVTVTLTVTSTASNPITTLMPALSIGPGAGQGSVIFGPSPASVAVLVPGGSTTFTWTWSASGAGLVTFTGTVTGIESGSALTVSASASATLLVQGQAGLALALAVPPTACAGQIIDLVATVTNTGQAMAVMLAVSGDPVLAGTGGLTLLSSPVVLTTLAGGASLLLTWSYSVTGGGGTDFTLTVTGVDVNSGSSLVAGPVTAGPILIGAPSGLEAAASAPALVPVGGAFTVTLTVTNTGAGDATGMVPAAAGSPGGAPVGLTGGPVPGGPVTIPAAAAQPFAWTYSVSGWGTVTFTLTAAGADSCGTARVSATVTVLLGTPANLVAGIVAAYPDPVCTGYAVRVVVSVTNTGQVPALAVRTATPYVEGAAALVSAPAWIPSLAGGASAHLTWTYSPTAPGSLRFTTTALGQDARDGGPVTAGPLPTPLLTATSPAVFDARLSAPATAIVGSWITVTLSVTNTGGQDAINVMPVPPVFPGQPVFPLSSAVLIPPVVPALPVTIPPGGFQTFAFTYSISGAGAIDFNWGVAGDTCAVFGQMLTAGGVTTVTALRPAQLVADSLVLTPSAVQAPGSVTAVLTLRNAGDAGLAVGALLRSVSGGSTTGLLAAGVSITPALTVTIAGNATRSFTWTHGVTLPCGIGTVIASATGFELATGRPLGSGSVASNQVTITGAPLALAVTPSATATLVASPVTISAAVRDACGLGVPNAPVTFALLEGGGTLSVVVTVTDTTGVARTILTTGGDLGRNAVWTGVTGTALVATTYVDGTNPLALDTPGAALDRNVLDTSTGRVVIARIFPRNGSPIEVRIFTASGRLVRTLRRLTPLGRDQFVAEWDGRTEDDFTVARGVYLVHILGGGLSEVLKVVVK